MSKIEIRTISAKQGLKQFIEFHTSLYKDDKYAVPYLFMSERDTLDPKKNRSTSARQSVTWHTETENQWDA